jgi:hypothetical protein
LPVIIGLDGLECRYADKGVKVIHRKRQVRQINQKRLPTPDIQKNIYIVFTLTSTLNVNNSMLLAIFNLSLRKKGRFLCGDCLPPRFECLDFWLCENEYLAN